jgi:putative colanic acid biosynthesis acetyltransferase WcaF
MAGAELQEESRIRVIPLKDSPGTREAWSKPAIVVGLWMVVEFLFVTNSLQPSSWLRAQALRSFGAKIEEGVILRPRLRVKFPWNLEIGANSWIGEGVWIHNQDKVTIGHDVCISQETFITTGSHDFRMDMALITKPITIEPGVWVCSRSIITMGSFIGRSSVVSAQSVVKGRIPENTVVGSKISASKRF